MQVIRNKPRVFGLLICVIFFILFINQPALASEDTFDIDMRSADVYDITRQTAASTIDSFIQKTSNCQSLSAHLGLGISPPTPPQAYSLPF